MAGKGGDLRLRLVQAHDLGPGERQVLAQVRERQHGPHARVRRDVGQPVGRVAGIERHVHGVDLQGGQHARVGGQGPVEQQPDPVAWADPPRQQVAGEPVGPRVEVVVGEGGAVGVDGGMVVGALRPKPVAPLLEQVLQALALLPARPVLASRADQDAVRGDMADRLAGGGPAGAVRRHSRSPDR
ncbi:hypothetical protein LUX57_04210 [Actinomadura madurae]|nr:hypothetical protein [Actinomadura madurae]MCP9964467.1 hypothetical protein [Actinomadura madurae]